MAEWPWPGQPAQQRRGVSAVGLVAAPLLVALAVAAINHSVAARVIPLTGARYPTPSSGPANLNNHRRLTRAVASALPVEVTLGSPGPMIPPSFSGVSLEYNELAGIEGAGGLADRLLALIRPDDGEPVVLRVGGNSADDAYWKVPTSHAPAWVFEIGDGWLDRLSELARRDGLHVMLDLNLAVHSPDMAASLARAAANALPAGSLVGLSVGNEPDLYVHESGLARERVASTSPSASTHWTRGYSPTTYRRDYGTYAGALTRAAPGVPLAAPEMTAFRPEWLSGLIDAGLLSPRLITIHAYATSICWPTTSTYYPTIASLLGENATAGLAAGLRGAVALARATGRKLLVTEFNSVSCGGKTGVTDSFATALWAPDALFEMIRAGVSGVNWHIRPGMPNAPFRLTPAGVLTRPELYGLALFAQMTGSKARLVGARLSGRAALHLKVWAVRSHTALHVLLINKGQHAARVSLRDPAGGEAAHVMRLWAPSVASTHGVTLGGRWIGSDARWHGREITGTLYQRQGTYALLVPGYSAVLLEIGRNPRPHS